MHNSPTIFAKYLEICKHFSNDLVNELEISHARWKRIADCIDGGEEYFCIDSKPIEVCRIARGKRCKMDYSEAPSFGYCASQGIYY